MSFVINADCVDVKDKACLQECPVDCIYEGPRQLYIHPDECIDCSACEPACPVEAIAYDGDLDEAGAVFADRNRQVFDLLGVGSPGGAGSFGPLAGDHPDVATLAAKAGED